MCLYKTSPAWCEREGLTTMQIQNQNPPPPKKKKTACIWFPPHSSACVIYCRILRASKTQKMELRRSPESNLWILSSAWILRNPVVFACSAVWVIVFSVARFLNFFYCVRTQSIQLELFDFVCRRQFAGISLSAVLIKLGPVQKGRFLRWNCGERSEKKVSLVHVEVSQFAGSRAQQSTSL